jgi:hypothetical protein
MNCAPSKYVPQETPVSSSMAPSATTDTRTGCSSAASPARRCAHAAIWKTTSVTVRLNSGLDAR